MKKIEPYYQLLPFAVLFFFANNLLLPEGLLFTALLSPVFLYFIFKERDTRILLKWGMLLLIPIPFHLASGVDIKTYIISSTLIFTVLIFFIAAIRMIQKSNNDLERMYYSILRLNVIFILLALIVLPFASFRDFLWYDIPISPNVPGFPRLKLLAYESSHYALLLSPILLYFLIKVMTGQTKHSLLILSFAMIPLVLSLSFGVIGAIVFALIIASIIYNHKLPRIYWSYLFYGSIIFIGLCLLIWIIWPTNPIYARIENILSGEDTSAKGRLFNSFWFAFDLIKMNNVFFGVGPGQIKILAHEMIIDYYKYSGDYAEIVRIPNSMGEMLAIYGIYGFVLKISLEIFFFIRLKVYNNYYNLLLFLFIFVYQFTGSFLVNVAEIGIWVLVFNTHFERFDMNNIKSNQL